MKNTNRIDLIFLVLTLVLALGGFLLSSSASLSTLGEKGGWDLPFDESQFASLLFGIGALFAASLIPFKFWRRYAIPLFLITLGLTIAVFLPVIGFSYNGARRWLSFGSHTLQPSEMLKLGFVIYFASWLAVSRERIKTFRLGFLPYLFMVGVLGLVLLKQPDTGTFMIIFVTSIAMFIAAGGRWLHLFYLFLATLIGLGALCFFRPYVRERVTTFINPSHDVRGASYQINQSLIAIGSGGIIGRGYGQSIQKFNYLPESIGDSVFAVVGEELGFIGSTLLIILFLLFGLWGLKVAARAPDAFGRLLVVGIVMMVTAGAFINISAMLGVIPLTGVPLTFVSHGGTALFFSLLSIGIALNVSRYQSHHQSS